MSTAQKITCFVELPSSIKDSHHIRMAVSHDIMQIQNFSVQCFDVELLKVISNGLSELILNINDYESKCKEDSSVSLESH